MDDYAKQTSPRENLIWAMPPLPLSSKPKKGLWRMAYSGSVDLQKKGLSSLETIIKYLKDKKGHLL